MTASGVVSAGARASCDVLIVGAGIVGAACADAFARGGARVRVLEAGRAAGRATAAGMGHILVLDDSAAQLALTKRSRDLWDARAAEWPKDVERDACGTLWIAADDEELQHARSKAAWYAERGIEAQPVDAAALARLEPNLRAGLAGGLCFPGDSVVYPPAAARALLRSARAHGATLTEGAGAARIGDGWVVTEDGARHDADVVVVAAGLATPTLLEAALRPAHFALVPKKGHLAITERAPGFVRHQLVELGYLKSAHGTDSTSVAFNAQPRATGQVLLGSSRQLGETDPRVEREVLARMVRRALEYLPGLAGLPVVRAWVGFRPATLDNLPVIGPLPAAPRTWLATGHEGVGITTSLGTAELLADRLFSRGPALDPRPFLPARFEREVHAHA
ncbi:MAG: FAD-dependent oxidoreductase [Planctomycetota bacterium]